MRPGRAHALGLRGSSVRVRGRRRIRAEDNRVVRGARARVEADWMGRGAGHRASPPPRRHRMNIDMTHDMDTGQAAVSQGTRVI